MDPTSIASLAVIAGAAVLAPVIAERVLRSRVPSVVLELGLGIVIGQHVLDLAEGTEFIESLSNLGLSFLMFMAGYEIDVARIRGRPLSRASFGWLVSLGLGLVVAGVLVVSGFALSDLLIGLALTTTALGTLLPMVRDAELLETPFGTHVLAVGTVGEFAPIVAITLLLSGDSPWHTTVLLVAFVVLAVVAVSLALRPKTPRAVAILSKHLHSSAQLPIRVAVLAVVALVWVASELGLDVLLGAFTAGIVVKLFSSGEDARTIGVKLDALGFGFLIPVFFVVSGMNFDVEALTDDVTTVLRLPLFLALFLVVRGLPALVLYRNDLPRPDRAALAFFSATALPLVVVITNIGLETDRMRPENAAALVGAAMVSVLVYPLAGFASRRAETGDGLRTGTVAGEGNPS